MHMIIGFTPSLPSNILQLEWGFSQKFLEAVFSGGKEHKPTVGFLDIPRIHRFTIPQRGFAHDKAVIP